MVFPQQNDDIPIPNGAIPAHGADVRHQGTDSPGTYPRMMAMAMDNSESMEVDVGSQLSLGK